MEKEYRDKLQVLLIQFSPVSNSILDKLIEAGIFYVYPKNEIIFSEKRYDAFEYFQVEGITHRYNKDEEGSLVTTGIYSGSAVIIPNFARTRNGQSIFSLYTLAECVLLKIPVGIFDEIRREEQQVWALGQRIVEREFIQYLNFEVLFRSYAAKDRLLYFRTHFKNLENLIPHSVIASYLGITPVSFSRLRNELAKESS